MSIGITKSEDIAADTPDAETATDDIIAAVLLLVEITDVLIDREEFVVVVFADVVLLVTIVDIVDVVKTIDEVPTSDVVGGVGDSRIFISGILPVVILGVGVVAVVVVVEFEGLATDIVVEQAAVVVGVAGGVVEPVETEGSRVWLESCTSGCTPVLACCSL